MTHAAVDQMTITTELTIESNLDDNAPAMTLYVGDRDSSQLIVQ